MAAALYWVGGGVVLSAPSSIAPLAGVTVSCLDEMLLSCHISELSLLCGECIGMFAAARQTVSVLVS